MKSESVVRFTRLPSRPKSDYKQCYSYDSILQFATSHYLLLNSVTFYLLQLLKIQFSTNMLNAFET